jgi:hypothetical protein
MVVRVSRTLLLLYYELETSPSLSCLGAAKKYFFLTENSHGATVCKMATVLILTLVVLLIFPPPPAFKWARDFRKAIFFTTRYLDF